MLMSIFLGKTEYASAMCYLRFLTRDKILETVALSNITDLLELLH